MRQKMVLLDIGDRKRCRSVKNRLYHNAFLFSVCHSEFHAIAQLAAIGSFINKVQE